MKIQLEQSDIDSGVKNSLSKCPLALAIKRVRPGARAAVSANMAWVNGFEFYLPKIAMEFHKAFELGLPVSLIEFVLPI